MSVVLRRALFLWCLFGLGCGPLDDDDDDEDAGAWQATDAGRDAGAAADAGRSDAGDVDAGAADAGVDAGEDDAGFDGGVVDAGFDAGVRCTAGGVPGTCLEVSVCVGTRRPVAGLCPGPANIQCCTPRYANSCDPNVEPQPNEGLTAAPDGCAQPGMVRIGVFCIDRFEASLLEVLDGGATRSWSPYFNPGARAVRATSVEGAVPQGSISQLQAAAACAGAGKRLCTDAEWLRACRGPDGLTYPYGPTRQSGVCNDARAPHPAVELYGTSASWVWSHLGSPCLNQLEDGLARTGSHPGCVSAEGVFDLMGNLHEWTADPAGTFRGGFYVDTVLNGSGCQYVTTAHTVSHWDYSTGFRCCADP